jgi:hypothetical protein
MLLARKLLAPGPQPKHPGTVNPPQADPRQSRGFTIMKLFNIGGFKAKKCLLGMGSIQKSMGWPRFDSKFRVKSKKRMVFLPYFFIAFYASI